MPERTTKEENLTSYRAFEGVAIQKRIAASFFLWKKFRATQSFSCVNARSPPLLQTATFRGQQGRISRPVKAILSGRL